MTASITPTTDRATSPRSGRIRTGLLIGGLAILAILGSAAALAVRLGTDAPPERTVHVRASAELSAVVPVPRRAVIESADGRTSLLVSLTRPPGTGILPALATDFDGSGGGEAVEVRCSSAATPWVVGTGSKQTAQLHCDRFVDFWRLRQVQTVQLDPAPR